MKYIQSIFITLTLLIFKCTCSADEKPTLGDADFPAPSPSKRHDKKVIQVKNGKYDLLLIGDSIIHSIGELEGKYEVFKSIWDKYYKPINAIRKGSYKSFSRDAVFRKVVTREEHPYTFTINVIISFVIGTGMIVGGIVTVLS